MNIETFFNNDDSKRFYFPGKIFIGTGISEKAAELVSQSKSVAIVIDQKLHGSAIHRLIAESCQSSQSATWIVSGAPFAQDVMEFVGQLDGTPDMVVSIGGGSAADFAKSIILHELFGTIDGVGVGDKRGMAPRAGAKRPTYLAIPTTAGSGAEASRYFVTYDKQTHGKVFGKTWQIIADWIFLDPQYLSSVPDAVLVACAFDAFVHLFETLIAKHERSSFGEMFSLDGIPRIMGALDEGIIHGRRAIKVHENLLYGATLAGIAISNVRTGNIHEAGGALLELTDLSHPETLFVFFRDAVEQYRSAIRDRELLLLSHLRLHPSFADFDSIDHLIGWWEMIFARVGIDSRIRNSIGRLKPNLVKAREHIFQRIYTDKVWIAKESPLVLDEAAIWSLIDRALARFGRVE